MTQATGAALPPSLGLATALVAGKVETFRSLTGRDGRFYITLLVMPAADEFSHPQTVEITSQNKLGDRGDTWRGKVKLGGRKRSYTTTDGDGERRTVWTADNKLHADE